MNPLIAQRIKQIIKGIEDLKAELVETQEQVKNLTESRNELQKKNWAEAKEIAVFRERIEEVTELKEQNARLLAKVSEFEERLRRILAYTETLESEFER
jgi:peptidoglycan hydrolase CwlO-like protein